MNVLRDESQGGFVVSAHKGSPVTFRIKLVAAEFFDSKAIFQDAEYFDSQNGD
ncbi:MAG: hypothetical protein JWO80_3082 [Bryobacterales bacterium]|nr:hypothetical protein [Bryobacterales bacterium]